MKKFLIAVCVMLFSLGIANAQDLGKATETYNKGAECLTIGQKQTAIDYFQKALKMGQGLGAPATALINNCKNAIASTMLSLAKELYNNKDFDGALKKFQETLQVAKQYNITDVVTETTKLIPQVQLQKDFAKANAAFIAKDYNTAIQTFSNIIKRDSTNSGACVRLIECLASINKIDEAKSYLPLAKKCGVADQAQKALGIPLLKAAASALSTGKFAAAIKYAKESCDYVNNPKAYLIAGQAAMKMNNDKEAIKYFEQYLKVAPKNRTAAQIALTIGALYQKANNKAKAIEFYKKAKALGINTDAYIKALKG